MNGYNPNRVGANTKYGGNRGARVNAYAKDDLRQSDGCGG